MDLEIGYRGLKRLSVDKPKVFWLCNILLLFETHVTRVPLQYFLQNDEILTSYSKEPRTEIQNDQVVSYFRIAAI